MAGKPGFIGTGDVLVTAGQSGRTQNRVKCRISLRHLTQNVPRRIAGNLDTAHGMEKPEVPGHMGIRALRNPTQGQPKGALLFCKWLYGG